MDWHWTYWVLGSNYQLNMIEMSIKIEKLNKTRKKLERWKLQKSKFKLKNDTKLYSVKSMLRRHNQVFPVFYQPWVGSWYNPIMLTSQQWLIKYNPFSLLFAHCAFFFVSNLCCTHVKMIEVCQFSELTKLFAKRNIVIKTLAFSSLFMTKCIFRNGMKLSLQHGKLLYLLSLFLLLLLLLLLLLAIITMQSTSSINFFNFFYLPLLRSMSVLTYFT